MQKICRVLFLLVCLLAPSLFAVTKEALLQFLAETEEFTQEEKEALATNVKKHSMFGFYAVTANATRASGIAVANAQRADMLFRTVEMKAVSSFATVFHVWEEEFDALDGTMSQQGRFPAVRQRCVFHAQIAPQGVIMKQMELDDGNKLLVLHVPAEKIIINRAECREDLRQKYGAALLEAYALSRENGDLAKCVLLQGDLHRLGKEIPDEPLLDYLQALRDNDDAVAAVLLEETASTFRQLPPAMQKAALEVVAASSRKDDALVLEDDKNNANKELK